MKVGFLVLATAGIISLPAPALAQHEGHEGMTGGFIARDGSIHDHSDGPAPTRERGEGGGRSGDGRSGSSGSTSSTPTTPKVIGVVTIGPAEYKITTAQAQKMSAILADYKDGMEMSGIASAIAVVYHIYNLISLNTQAPAYDAFLKIITGDPDQLIDQLTVGTRLAQLQRTQAISAIDLQIVNAPTPEEKKMWRSLRDIFAHPQRYRNGGIKFDPRANKLMLRPDAGARLRSIASDTLNSGDVAALRFLTNEMMTYGPSRDFVIDADYTSYLKGSGGITLTLRDEMILNRALLTAGPQTKIMLANRFQIFSKNPGLNQRLWLKLWGFLYTEEWEHHNDWWMTYDAVQSLGHEDDDLPEETDIARTTPYYQPGILIW